MPKNKVRLNVCSVQCTLITEESESYMKELAAEVERMMEGFMRATGSLQKDLAAVTTALSFCDEAKKLKAAQPGDLTKRLTETEKKLAAAEEELCKTKQQLVEALSLSPADCEPHQKTGADLKNPLRPMEEFGQQGLVSFFEKK